MVIEVRPATVFADAKMMVWPKRPHANVSWCLTYRILLKENLPLRGPACGGTGLAYARPCSWSAWLPRA